MLKKIVVTTKKQLLETRGLIKISLFTTRGHSISNIFLLLWNINNLLVYKYGSGVSLLLVFNYFRGIITSNHLVLWSVLLIIFILVGYFILFPIANAAVISLFAGNKSTADAMGKGLSDFFVFFEYNALHTTFSLITFVVTFLRLMTLDVLGNSVVIVLIGVWLFLVLLAMLLWPFVNIYIALEGMQVYQAIKKSIELTLSNLSLVIRALIHQGIITIYFYFRIGVLFFFPAMIMYIVIYFHRFNNGVVSSVLWILGIIGVLLFGYISAIIYAYFEGYRYNIYRHIIAKKDK